MQASYDYIIVGTGRAGCVKEVDLARHDVVARSIIYGMKRTGSGKVRLDTARLPASRITLRFRTCTDSALGTG